MSEPKAWCACGKDNRRWNGYGTCLHCGGAYEHPPGELAPIVVPPTVYEFPREEES